ncbi:ABC-2 type transport system ATP-binding protein [Clostridium tetanomorphum]|uniref:ABC transporter ATP-binding protein n=1 Tax=Clostridium tetanomorphum TaxID=1553 RepID=A0A923IZ97_CLOTT|nr:ABC transporter ATP-binding protein [Clostridium tetanomorphum]KAJ52685.1 ABC transporter ATP-binding protein [Clostridium tetanomorphum DSM 665]MBC2396762.1 ABC transporter ATP-binding protein [Clostridium tetanomorphum]MBP1863278.1 ABC-2 type transport system ATP-binding protein [Clostridium tetanomorphum]NRS84386.1 ABC-2 type transport system ATP-binding protein [Clostridium tetanomorphum]NRZ97601.1 ABC-2 type transport system ATP-binding protein [Clostridium tetanomorphum]
MSDVLNICNVSKKFENFNLNNISFNIQENCITGFLGKNGAGKTTLIKILLGLLKKDSGKITFFSNKYGDDDSSIKNKIGVVLDDGFFYENLTLNEMKNVIAACYSVWDEETYEEYLKKFRLNPKQSISTLSKGMKLKYSLAIALSHGADFLIMDEPTSGLDPEIRKELMDILNQFVQEEGRSVFFSTHITSDLERCADEIIIIDKGKIVEQVGKDDLIESYRLIKGSLDDLEKIKKVPFKILDKSRYGFTGITREFDKIQSLNSNIIMEKANLEDIFLTMVGE